MIDPILVGLLLTIPFDILFTMLRASVLNSRPSHLVTIRELRPASVDQTLALLEKPRLRVSLRVVIVFVHFLLAGFLWLLIQEQSAESFSVSVAVLLTLLAVCLILIMEFGLERLMIKNPEQWALRLAPLAVLTNFILTPISALLVALLGYGDIHNSTFPVTESELKNWVEEGQPEGTLEKGERKMIYSIFQFGTTLAREIMIPRIDMLALEINSSLHIAVEMLSNSGHSRLPVYEETIDNIVGLLYAKDLLMAAQNGDQPLSSMRELLRPAYFVPEVKKVDELLTEMQSRRVHMAIVIDEYGGVAGLVTLEDILEEIIGEIQDEYDQAEEMLFQQVSEEEYIFQGRIDLNDFNEIMGSNLPKESADTLGGFLYGEMGRVPAGGERVETDGLILTVEQVIGRRIRKVRARRLQSTQELEAETSDVDK